MESSIWTWICLGLLAGFPVLGIAANCLARRSETFRRFWEHEWEMPGCTTLRERISQKWSEVAALVDECSRLRGVPAKSARLWKAFGVEAPSPERDVDSRVAAESLGALGSSLVTSAEDGRRLCHTYLRGRQPCREIMTMNTLFSVISRVCRKCLQEESESCLLSGGPGSPESPGAGKALTEELRRAMSRDGAAKCDV